MLDEVQRVKGWEQWVRSKYDRKEIYYFSEKKGVDFIVKEGLEVTAAINGCYDLSDRETYLRELSGLHEALNYFGLRKALLITAEAQPQEITDRGLKIEIRPFHQ